MFRIKLFNQSSDRQLWQESDIMTQDLAEIHDPVQLSLWWFTI